MKYRIETLFVVWTFEKGKMNFLIEDILKFFLSSALIIVKAKDFILWLEHSMEIRLVYYERWYAPQFSTEVLQIMTGIG